MLLRNIQSHNLNNFVALNSSYENVDDDNTVTVCRVNSAGRYSYIKEGPPHFF